jgi:hypothetical protein
VLVKVCVGVRVNVCDGVSVTDGVNVCVEVAGGGGEVGVRVAVGSKPGVLV